jgi:hypothetical protein
MEEPLLREPSTWISKALRNFKKLFDGSQPS